MATFVPLPVKNYDTKLRARIQSTGRLGFGEDAIRLLRLKDGDSVSFFNDADAKTLPALYMVVLSEANGDSFTVRTSGKYLYLPTARLFDAFGIDYKNKTAIFDLVRTVEHDDELQGEVYRMKLRYKEPKAKDGDGDNLNCDDDEEN